MLGITDSDATNSGAKAKSRNPNKRKRHVTFNEEEIIINPEDVDPSVGRFRNLVQTTVVIPAKRPRFDSSTTSATMTSVMSNPYADFARPAPVAAGHSSIASSAYLPHHLYDDLPPSTVDSGSHHHHHHAGRAGTNSGPGSSDLNAKFGIMLPNPAPEVLPLSSSGDGEGTASSTAGDGDGAEHRSDESADSTSHLDGNCDWVLWHLGIEQHVIRYSVRRHHRRRKLGRAAQEKVRQGSVARPQTAAQHVLKHQHLCLPENMCNTYILYSVRSKI